MFSHYTDERSLPVRHDLRGPVCIHGHFNGARGFGVWQYYPRATQFLMFLRDPFDRFVSLWRYMHRRKHDGEHVPALESEPNFEEWLCEWANKQEEGICLLSPIWFMPRPPGAVPLEEMLDSFVFIGLIERFSESVHALASVLGKPPIELPHLNATPRLGDEYSQWRGFYERHFAEEYELYEAAAVRCHRLIEDHQS